ncbi:NAD(P)/FAD-dependent oxidoreductase, partial [Amycolatopsis sp. H20-H5]|uniref:NAD(P)/FAD-dependent oxidoreductase n=1 Tax=Amycolatopsis sp. H20-H5 TaxID=3046309 RepID=UPI002DB76FAE
MTERIVVVGAGLAGLRAAERVRELGFGGELVILGAEPGMPYHRPALSKQVLTGEIEPAGTRLAAFGDVDAQWRLDTAAVHLQPGRQVLHLPGAEELRYDGLVIATGVEPRRLAEVPHGHPRVVVLRTLADAVTLHQGLAGTTGPVAVLGGGFIGCEVASSLRAMNRDVAIIDRSHTLLGDELGAEVGARLTAVHAAHGVRLELGTSIRRWRLEPTGLGIELIDGRTLEVECAVVALGTVPAVSWLRGAKLPLDDGVVCGPTCHVLG